MSLSKKAIEEFKEIFKKNYGKELTDAEAYESASNLVGFYDALYQIHRKDVERQFRLRKEPEGFTLDDGEYTCSICGSQMARGEIWYDKWGVTCALCRKAVQTKAIPYFACSQKDSWYPMWEMDNKFGIKHQTARKLVREGKLKARIVLGENSNPYEYIFLKKENPELIDPDRHSPGRKSWDRNRNKIAKAKTKEVRKKAHAEWEAEQKKIREILRKHRG